MDLPLTNSREQILVLKMAEWSRIGMTADGVHSEIHCRVHRRVFIQHFAMAHDLKSQQRRRVVEHDDIYIITPEETPAIAD